MRGQYIAALLPTSHFYTLPFFSNASRQENLHFLTASAVIVQFGRYHSHLEASAYAFVLERVVCSSIFLSSLGIKHQHNTKT